MAALVYAGPARGTVDERSVVALRRLRQADESLAEFKMLVGEQFWCCWIGMPCLRLSGDARCYERASKFPDVD